MTLLSLGLVKTCRLFHLFEWTPAGTFDAALARSASTLRITSESLVYKNCKSNFRLSLTSSQKQTRCGAVLKWVFRNYTKSFRLWFSSNVSHEKVECICRKYFYAAFNIDLILQYRAVKKITSFFFPNMDPINHHASLLLSAGNEKSESVESCLHTDQKEGR